VKTANVLNRSRLYDWQLGRSLNRFVNTPTKDERFDPYTRVSSIRFINDDDTALLMTGTGKPDLLLSYILRVRS
jgi:hypothetical protein